MWSLRMCAKCGTCFIEDGSIRITGLNDECKLFEKHIGPFVLSMN
jgi:coenzyme F420-reducing hydrogenase beta subunit